MVIMEGFPYQPIYVENTSKMAHTGFPLRPGRSADCGPCPEIQRFLGVIV